MAIGVIATDNATRALRKPLDSTGNAAIVATPPVELPLVELAEQACGELKPGQMLLSYELGEKIGVGGMGTVYKATHQWLGRDVAIKFISSELLGDADVEQRFAYEARAVGTLDHPNIVRATDAGRAGNTHYLVTEFVDGIDLHKLVRQRGPLAVADACEAIRQAALGLQHACERGLVHRDVKPSNLILDHVGCVKLLDFGLARMTAGQATMTSTGQLIGTLDYLAPEQASDARNVDIRGDIYSLGCTFYYLLTGEPPFFGANYQTPASKIKGHLVDSPRPPQSLRRGIPAAVVACLDRMLAKAPADRYQMPGEVAHALARHAERSGLAELVTRRRGPRSDAPSASPSFLSGMLRVLTAAPSWLGRGIARSLGARPSSFDKSRSGRPLFSISGLIMLVLLMLGLFQFFIAPHIQVGPPLPRDYSFQRSELGTSQNPSSHESLQGFWISSE